ncbi:MAG TPA: Na+/H+ antiporter NhaC family protein, partial [Candidatus Babeliales bacterium]|nr:Na+/H+ antiporter NhaC family protein [Candidatus Babeliales bacterium]
NLELSTTIYLILASFKQQLADLDNWYAYAFVFITGIIVVLLNYSGGTIALARLITDRLKTAKSAQFAAVLLSCCFFIDDYLSCLAVGHIMRPITDRLRIPKANLAFLLAAIPAPLAIAVPISSWVGVIVSRFDQVGISLDHGTVIAVDPYTVFLQTIPFVFYAVIMLAGVWFLLYREISFGTLKHHETVAATTGNLFGGQAPLVTPADTPQFVAQCSLTDFLLPILALVSLIIVGVLYQGGYWLLGGTHTLIQVFQQQLNLFPVLFVAAASALSISLLAALVRHKIQWTNVPQIFRDGIKLMFSAILILLLAGVFGTLLREHLHTGEYLANLLLSHIDLIFLPLMIFVVTFLVATATGSAWGTLAIVVPLAVPMIVTLLQLATPLAPDLLYLLLPSLGAILSGAAAGDHFSPISGATVMSASSSGAYLIDHIKTQMEYATPMILATMVAYLVVGWLAPVHSFWGVSLALVAGLATCFGLLLLLHKLYERR